MNYEIKRNDAYTAHNKSVSILPQYVLTNFIKFKATTGEEKFDFFSFHSSLLDIKTASLFVCELSSWPLLSIVFKYQTKVKLPLQLQGRVFPSTAKLFPHHQQFYGNNFHPCSTKNDPSPVVLYTFQKVFKGRRARYKPTSDFAIF